MFFFFKIKLKNAIHMEIMTNNFVKNITLNFIQKTTLYNNFLTREKKIE